MTLSTNYSDGEVVGGNRSPTVLDQPRSKTAGGPYMARLGEYEFSLETSAFETLSRKTEYRWEGQNRIGRAPAQQFLGLGEDTIELKGTIYPHFRGGLGQMAQLREAAGKGKPLPFTYAFERLGQYNGLWCIKEINDERSVPLRQGHARKIEFTLSLVAYGEDAETAAKIEQKLKDMPASDDAGDPPVLSYDDLDELLSNGIDVDDLVDVFDDDWSILL